MKHFNSVDALYDDGVVVYNGKYVCSCCNKEYKTPKGANNHFAKRNCHSYQQVFNGTDTEEMFYDIYVMLTAMTNYHTISKYQFTKNKLYYNKIAKFYMYCLEQNIINFTQYLEFTLHFSYVAGSPFDALHLAKYPENYEMYLKRRKYFVTEKDSELFFNTHRTRIDGDGIYTIRALERGEIKYGYLFDHIDYDSFINSLSDVGKTRLENFLVSMQ